MSFFMLVFCVSGILLNHRSLIKDVNISRAYLPSRYEYVNWNGGLLRGTLVLDNNTKNCSLTVADSCRHLLLYGNGGIWLTDSKASCFKDFNKGLPVGADYRQIRNVIKASNGSLFAVSPLGLYRYGAQNAWREVKIELAEDEKFTDIASHGDTLVALARSYAYVALPPYTNFKRVSIHAPKNYDGKVTAFRTMWLLHSGELFGTGGKLIADGIAFVIILLSITGIIFLLRPKRKYLLRNTLQLHDKAGRYTIVLTLLIALTGWCLRPPVMIALVLNKIPPLPGTTLCSDNPWNDKLRMLRYDEDSHDWLLSTSEGFYSLNLKNATVKAIASAPPVSVMGLNVLQKDKHGRWLCGSFSGLYVWDRRHAAATDYFTGEPAPKKAGAPFGKKAIAGMSQNFEAPVIADYYEGTSFAPQPAGMNNLPMSLWNVALEVHSGRIFIGSVATYIFIFVMGILAVWCLWSGYKIRLSGNTNKGARRHASKNPHRNVNVQ